MLSLKRTVAATTLMMFTAGCSEEVQFASIERELQRQKTCEETGTCPPNIRTVNESYKVPTGAGKVDVMFVLDTTPVMFKTISALHKRMKALTDMLPSNIDWQFGIVNSSLSNFDLTTGRYRAGELLDLAVFPKMEVSGPPTILRWDTPNADELFIGNTSFLMRTWGTNEESFCDAQPFCTKGASEPMRTIVTSINNRAKYNNSTFFREGAVFAPVIISATDENNNHPKVSSAEVIEVYNQALGAKMAGMKAYSLVIPPGDKTCLDNYSTIFREGDGGMYGTNLAKFAMDTGGKMFSLCDADYSPVLASVIAGMQPSIKTITLSHKPVEGSVKIIAVPAAPLNYVVVGTIVTFAESLPPGATLSVSYQVKIE